MSEAQARELLARLSGVLAGKGWKMATAESCTGGWIAKCCTDLPGSSAWFERGFVTYSNAAKIEMLGVPPEVLSEHGAVSRAVAEGMALGARRCAPVEVGLAVTGIAGPDGGSPDKPVGTVWFAWSIGGDEVESQRCRFSGDRESIRWQAVLCALQGLWARLERS